MFGNLGVHIIQYPTGRFGFVGTLPGILGDIVPATTADVMGGRAHEHPHTGEIVTIKFPSFETRDAAIAHATSRGVAVRAKD